uniref:MOB kinase activator 2 n=1 Tax=Macaca fascicularis TaxID=9541 RepID=A0A7N9CS68_MACFA
MDWLMGKSKAKPNGKKPAAEERKAYLEPEHTKARITDFQFKELVVLPREIDLNEWLASNTTTFFHHINLQYSTISEFCTGEACQTMAVCNTQYYWYDERGKKVKCTAPQYVDFVMSSVQKLVTDEDVFPTKYGREFPSSFESLVRKICRHLFHVLAHIYWAHFKETLALELHGHLNTLYVHFILFAREFNLLDPKETAIMDDLTEPPQPPASPHAGGGDPQMWLQSAGNIFSEGLWASQPETVALPQGPFLAGTVWPRGKQGPSCRSESLPLPCLCLPLQELTASGFLNMAGVSWRHLLRHPRPPPPREGPHLTVTLGHTVMSTWNLTGFWNTAGPPVALYSARKLVWEMTLWLRLGICAEGAVHSTGRPGPHRGALRAKMEAKCPRRAGTLPRKAGRETVPVQ